jgi:hypothetical protein
MQCRLGMNIDGLEIPMVFCKQCLTWIFEYPQAGCLPGGMDSLNNDPNNPVVREAQ